MPCPLSDNCEIGTCTAFSDSTCTKCIYDRGEEIKAYKLTSSGSCEQQCSWQSDSKYCYPGICDSTPASCTCAEGFDGNNCMEMSEAPTVSHCSITLQRDNGISSQVMTCSTASTLSPVYSSLDGTGISVEWHTRYTGPSSVQYPIPYYVNDYKVGVTSATISWKIVRGGAMMINGTINCDLNHNQDDPNQSTHSCPKYGVLGEQLQHADSLIIITSSMSGGYILLNNYDFSTTPSVGPPMYYQGRTESRFLNVIIDLEAPTHCSLKSPTDPLCQGDILGIGNPYTKSSDIRISWSTWYDSISGLASYPYECRVYKMVANNDLLVFQEAIQGVIPEFTRIGDDYEANFEPTSPGVYCAVLRVGDVAGNFRYARHCLLFDDESDVSIIDTNPINLVVDGELLDHLGSDVWTTGEKDVHLSWQGHFINQLHVDQNMLYAIGDNNNIIDDSYDSDTSPAGRPISAIDNVNGIVLFEIGTNKDRLGGVTLNIEPTWMLYGLNEEYTDQLETATDGDTFRLWIRATDVLGNTNTDFISIHIDSTPPTIGEIESSNANEDDPSNIYLMYEDRLLINVFDEESGIHKAHWQFHSKDGHALLAEGDVEEVRDLSDQCDPTECYCILGRKYCYKLRLDVTPIVDNNQEIVGYLNVTIQNNALMVATKGIELTIDSRIGTTETSPKLSSSTSSAPVTIDSRIGTTETSPKLSSSTGSAQVTIDSRIHTTETSPKLASSTGSASSLSIILPSVLGILVLLLIVALVIFMKRRPHTLPEISATHVANVNPSFINDVTNNTYASASVDYRPTPSIPQTQLKNPPALLNMKEDEYASPFQLGITTNAQKSRGNTVVTEINSREIRKDKLVAEANHSLIYKCHIVNIGVTCAAIKTLKESYSPGEKDTLLHEIKMMRKMQAHPSVIRLIGYTTATVPVAMVMEFAPHGDLSTLLQQSRGFIQETLYDNQYNGGNLSSNQLCTYAMHVCSGMEHLGRYKIIHRNLGARNILVGENFVCKITDFGRAVEANIDGTYVETTEVQLPIRWTAVEGIRNSLFSFQSDVWSFGVLMWEIITLGSKPYGNLPIDNIGREVLGGFRLDKPGHCTNKIYNVMQPCWHDIPDQRPSFKELSKNLKELVKDNNSIDTTHFDGDEYMDISQIRR